MGAACPTLRTGCRTLRKQRVEVKTVDLRINLESLSFFLKNIEDGVI